MPTRHRGWARIGERSGVGRRRAVNFYRKLTLPLLSNDGQSASRGAFVRQLMLAAAIALALPLTVLAETGSELQTLCANEEGTVKDVACLYYISGVHESYDVLVAAAQAKRLYCQPSGATNGQLYLVTKKYLDAHPEELHLPASYLVLMAFGEAWPCP